MMTTTGGREICAADAGTVFDFGVFFADIYSRFSFALEYHSIRKIVIWLGKVLFCYNKNMKIKKLGHCCLVIETKGIRIMTDPGNYSTLQADEKNIDIILITHEHTDHLHIESLKK